MNLRYAMNDRPRLEMLLFCRKLQRPDNIRLISSRDTRLLEILHGGGAVVRGNVHLAKSVKGSFPRNEKDLLPVDHGFCVHSRAHAEPISHMKTTWNHFIYICGLSMRETDSGGAIAHNR